MMLWHSYHARRVCWSLRRSEARAVVAIVIAICNRAAPGILPVLGEIMLSFRYAAHARRMGIFAAIIGVALLITSGIAAAQETKPTSIPAGKARLVLNRVAGIVFVAGAAIVKVNGQEVATLWADKSAVVDIAPGAVVVSVAAWASPGDVAADLKAKAGTTYYFEIAPRPERINFLGTIGAIGQYIDAATKKNTGHFSIRQVKKK